MTDNDLLDKIGKLIEPVRAQVYEQGANIVRLMRGQKRIEERLDGVEKSQSQTNTSLAQVTTALEAIKAGQEDIRVNMATKPDIFDLRAKLDKIMKNYEKRIDDLEKEVGLPHPHKN